MNEVLLIDKPAGWTSFDVVAKIRGQLRRQNVDRELKIKEVSQVSNPQPPTPTRKRVKVGHAGTLDPFATGLLVILLGDACKMAQSYLKLDKTYEFTAKLGETSSTGDPEGEKRKGEDSRPPIEAVEEALKAFQGKIKQTPPAYSAIKIDGQRAYKLAREGKEVTIPAREVTIHSLELVNYDYPYVTCITHVSSGTYIRTLVEDIGKKLGTGAYCSELRRTTVGQWSLEDACSLEEALTRLG